MSTALDALRLTVAGGMLRFEAKIVPGASRTRIMGLRGDALRLAVAAAPEAGRANREIVRFLADALGVPASDIAIVDGRSSPFKRIAVRGLAADSLRGGLAVSFLRSTPARKQRDRPDGAAR